MPDGNDYNIHERVAVLEAKMSDLKEIKDKLDQLIELKAKGMGAFWLIGLIIGSGVLGLITTVASVFNKGHL